MTIRKTIAGKAGLVAAVALAALLTACATATPYQPNIAGQKAGGASADGQVSHESLEDLGTTLDVNELSDRNTTGRGGLLQDFFVDESVTQAVGDQPAHVLATCTDEPRNAHHPSRHRRTLCGGVVAVKPMSGSSRPGRIRYDKAAGRGARSVEVGA